MQGGAPETRAARNRPAAPSTYERDSNGSDEAMFRRYSRAQARFEQADPYDGSYDLADPQSFNRYSYTQNDPVNFTDPSGLDDEEFINDPADADADPIRTTVSAPAWSPWGYFLPASQSGLGPIIISFIPAPRIPLPGEPPLPTPQPERLPFNSCEEFVNYLVDRAVEYAGRDSWSWTKARQLGTEMGVTAYSRYEGHINNGFAGFKRELTEAGTGTEAGAQGAGIYGHIFFAGGSTLYSYADPAGHVAFIANMLKDRAQALGGQPQGRSEIAGNFAGQAVGTHLWNFLSGKTPADPERLRNSLTSELCGE